MFKMEIAKKLFRAMEILVVIFNIVELSTSESQTQIQSLHEDIVQLASALPGCYSNARQYYAYFMSKTVPHRKKNSLFLLRAEFYKLESPLFNDSLTIYFQDFTKSSKIPFSSGFYSFTPDYPTDTIRMKVYTFKKAVPGLRVSYTNYSIPEGSPAAQKLTTAFHQSNLKAHSSCNMVWKKTSQNTFTGVTRSDCLANLGKDSIRISVSMTVTGSRITLTEGWYNLDDRASLRELKIPYILKRKSQQPSTQAKDAINSSSRLPSRTSAEQNPVSISSLQAKENLSSHHRLPSLKTKDKTFRGNLRKYHEINSLKRKLYNRLNSYRNLEKATNSQKGQGQRRVVTRRRVKGRVLRKYRQIKSSLEAGLRVFYKIDLSKCKMAAQVPIERLSYGGEIKKFQIIREQRKRKRETKIYFSTSGTSMTAKGVETIEKEMTLHRGGHVEVKVIKRLQGRRRQPKQYTFQCKLFNNKKRRRGSVKIFTDQSSPPSEAKSLQKLTRSLGKGRNLWLVADVTKCQGRRSETTIMAGGLISDYEMVNKGKTLQLFLPVDQTNQGSSHKSHTSGFVIKIFKNNDVILTWVNSSNENTAVKRKFKFRPAYHCELSHHLTSVSNEAGDGSVNVFIR